MAGPPRSTALRHSLTTDLANQHANIAEDLTAAGMPTNRKLARAVSTPKKGAVKADR